MDLMSFDDIINAIKGLKQIAYYVACALDINETKAFELISRCVYYEIITNSFIEQSKYLLKKETDEH